MAKIAVLGGSFGGLTAALELKRLLGKEAEVTVISDDDRFVFLPSLPWLIMGWRKPEDITLKVSGILKPKGIDFINEAAKQVDPESRKVLTATKGSRKNNLSNFGPQGIVQFWLGLVPTY